ncbi:MAG: hypothetical protein KBD63_03535 [Bacteriovoracaceae bacterium]|nr:hypothetical protein [Bacteriovoracaceae bacterium]
MMLKQALNFLSQPVFFFSGMIVCFFLALKYYQFVGTKKFGKIALVVSLLIATFFVSDPIFFMIISTPDNIPIIILISTVGFFTWYSLYRAAENDKRIAEGGSPREGLPENREKVWAWPNLVYIELFAIIACSVFLIVWAIIFKAPLEEPANPTWAPNPAKAPWYFLGLQEMLVYFDPWIAGVLLPGLVVVGLIAIPYLDHNPKGNGYFTFADRKFAVTTFLFGWLVLWIFLIIVGTFLRGPNWTFYGPFEFWDLHKVEAINNINVSEIFWIKMFATSMPKNIFIREFLGLFLVIVYYVAGIKVLTKKWGVGLLEKIGSARYYILVFLMLTMMSLPIKMYLRWFLNLKYIVAMPEFELNI